MQAIPDQTKLYVIGLIIVLGIIILVVKLIQAERISLVRQYSTRYAQMQYLKSVYQFKEIAKELPLYKECGSKAEFDRFRARDFLIGIAMDQHEILEDFVYDAEFNRVQYEAYSEEIAELPPTPEEIVKRTKIGIESFDRYEKELCVNLYVKPILDPLVVVKSSYTSAKGRNTYSYEESFTVAQIRDILCAASERINYEQGRAYQRSIMTESLRYSVLQRDHFRCVICGASVEEGAKLEVDHIKPISKGGKTELSNLRTLCKSCNRGKRDRYNPDGIN